MAGPIDWTEVRRAKENEVESLRSLAVGEVTPSRRDFSQFIGSGRGELGIVATFRRRDPYSGASWDDLDLAAAAAALDETDVAGLAVTTEPLFHAGRIDDLAIVAQAATAPLLRDDPLLHPLQIYQSRARGADACVVAVAWTADDTLAEMVRVARTLHMTAVLAVADDVDVARALAQERSLVGLLAPRNDGRIDVDRARRLASLVPARESLLLLGDVIDTAQLAELRGVVDSALVARAFIGRDDVAAVVEELRQ